jgi:hypothetical protein
MLTDDELLAARALCEEILAYQAWMDRGHRRALHPVPLTPIFDALDDIEMYFATLVQRLLDEVERSHVNEQRLKDNNASMLREMMEENQRLGAEVERMRPVYLAAKAAIAHQRTADIAHVIPGWLKTALDLSKAMELAVDAALASEAKEPPA